MIKVKYHASSANWVLFRKNPNQSAESASQTSATASFMGSVSLGLVQAMRPVVLPHRHSTRTVRTRARIVVIITGERPQEQGFMSGR